MVNSQENHSADLPGHIFLTKSTMRAHATLSPDVTQSANVVFLALAQSDMGWIISLHTCYNEAEMVEDSVPIVT